MVLLKPLLVTFFFFLKVPFSVFFISCTNNVENLCRNKKMAYAIVLEQLYSVGLKKN